MTTDPASARVLIISANQEEVNMAAWPLGAASVAAALRSAGHEALLLDLLRRDDPLVACEETLRGFRPDIIGVSVRNIDDQRMKETTLYLDGVQNIIARCRELTAAPVVLGGAGYSIFPESALAYLGADLGLPGEGEASFPELVNRIIAGSDLRGPYLLHRLGAAPVGTRTFINNLDDYPLPDPGIIGLAPYRIDEFWMPVQTRRGCAMACSYCSTPLIEGTRLRKRSPDAVVRWLSRCVEAGMRRFYFVDNTFNLPHSYALELCRAIAGADLGISWRCILYPWKMDERLAEAMARAGCVEVSIGSESGSGDMLRSMNKRFSPRDVRRAADLVARYGIRRMGFLMLGGPGETMASAEESLAFADSLNLEAVKITIGIRIYPQTDLSRKAVEEGMVSPDDNLLVPRFYMVPELEGPLRELVESWRSSRPAWIV